MLVVTPFCETIKSQFPMLAVLNVFHGVETEPLVQAARSSHFVPCLQLPYIVSPVHQDWHNGLEQLKKAVARQEYSVAIIGSGASSQAKLVSILPERLICSSESAEADSTNAAFITITGIGQLTVRGQVISALWRMKRTGSFFVAT